METAEVASSAMAEVLSTLNIISLTVESIRPFDLSAEFWRDLEFFLSRVWGLLRVVPLVICEWLKDMKMASLMLTIMQQGWIGAGEKGGNRIVWGAGDGLTSNVPVGAYALGWNMMREALVNCSLSELLLYL